MSAEPPPLETMALVCPHCGGAFQVRSEYRGLQVACPLCQQAIEVPVASGAIPPPPPPVQAPALEGVAGVESASPQRASAGGSPAGSTPATPLDAPAEPESEPAPPRELTREERQRLRRRFRIAVAVLAAVVLAIALRLLLRIQ